MSWVLFTVEMRRHRRALFVWALALMLLSLFRMAQFPSFHDENEDAQAALEQFSPTEIEMFGLGGLDLTEIVGYYGARVYSPLLLLSSVYVVMLASTVLSKEEDDKTIDFLMAKPVTRNAVVTAKFVAAICCTAALDVALFLAAWAMCAGFERGGYDLRALGALSLGSSLVHLAFAAVAFLLSVFVVRVRTIYPLTIGLVLGAYFLFVMTNSADGARWVRYVSFFASVDVGEVLRDHAIGGSSLLLLAVTAGAVGASYAVYNRKDFTI